MSFNMDFTQDKPDLRELIPAGTVVFVEMRYTPGGDDPTGCKPEQKEGALTKSKPPSDTKYLKSEFSILRGPYKGRKFWANMTTEGGELDEKGNSKAAGITRKTIRAILDSSAGLASKDETPDAQAKRVLVGFKGLQNRRFICTVKIEPGKDGYPPKNGLGYVLTIDSKNYPKSEAELDRPAQAAAVAAPAAPIWGGGAQTAATTGDVVEPVQTAAAPAPVQTASAPVPAPQNDAIPAWAKAA